MSRTLTQDAALRRQKITFERLQTENDAARIGVFVVGWKGSKPVIRIQATQVKS